jgi:CubicO group peptidase (beta-lactamase class C family)
MRNLVLFLTFLSIVFSGTSCRDQKVIAKNSEEFVFGVKPEDAGFSSEKLARIDTVLTEYISKGIMPNAVTFIARHGKVVHNKAYGWQNIENKFPIQLNTIYRNASQTKAITSVGLMLLFEKSKFLLDEPVSKYIPEFKNPQVLVKLNPSDSSYTCRPAKREITIRHLLSHTSGIPYGNIAFEKAGIPGVNSLKPLTIGEVVKKIAKLPLDLDPGEAFLYGLNTDVIGYLIEVLSGQPLDEYLRKEVFEPLEMKDSYFYLPAEKESRLVTLYSNDSLNGQLYVCKNIANQTYPVSGAKTYFSGGAGLVGTIQDYANFCKMLMNGGSFNGRRILGRKTIDLMKTNQIGDNEVWDRQNKFGLGFEINTTKGITMNPGSLGAFGWGGMYSTDYWMDPEEDMIMIIYTNAYPFSNPDINTRFKILVYQALTDKK